MRHFFSWIASKLFENYGILLLAVLMFLFVQALRLLFAYLVCMFQSSYGIRLTN